MPVGKQNNVGSKLLRTTNINYYFCFVYAISYCTRIHIYIRRTGENCQSCPPVDTGTG